MSTRWMILNATWRSEMAKINVNFDTKEKTLACSIDDKPMEHIEEAVIYKQYGSDQFSMRISSRRHDKEQDAVYMEHVMAKNSIEGFMQHEVNSISLGEDLFKQIPLEFVQLDVYMNR